MKTHSVILAAVALLIGGGIASAQQASPNAALNVAEPQISGGSGSVSGSPINSSTNSETNRPGGARSTTGSGMGANTPLRGSDDGMTPNDVNTNARPAVGDPKTNSTSMPGGRTPD